MDRSLKIGVVGLGLIGGSIFKALCALRCDISAVSKSVSTRRKAKAYSKNVSKSLKKLKDCDIIFVCTPMNKTIDILNQLDKMVSKSTVVVDVCSLKSFVCQRKYKYIFIPSHPMAGSEFDGFDYSFETLFQDAKWVLTPFKFTKRKAVKDVKDIIKALGAKPVVTKPEVHDEAVALISHMPMVVAQGLFKAAKGNRLALRLAASGFRDMTRLAMSNEEMARDMVNLNSENIQKALLQLYAAIGELLASKHYLSQISEIKKERKTMYFKEKNNL
ncbi:MAG: prephenate dehydrogenase/arogenate dehydrogenase family protein [Candidatus Gastranaerophilales bacterium]|nr:prephenate dehydrogenase/arogenate dehydrogenase family protein [Candidatus Gastranaerophilales bacterium]